MTDIAKDLWREYSKLDRSAAVREFLKRLCGLPHDVIDEFAAVLEVASILEEVTAPPTKQRAPRKDKGTRRQQKPVQAVA